MSVEAVAMLRSPGWEPDEDLDVRELEDAVLVFLETPYGDPDDMLEALVDEVGPDAVAVHDDHRGVFFFPDALEPEEAETYEAVLTAVGSHGAFVAIDDDEAGAELDTETVRGVLDDALQALGLGSVEDMQKLLEGGDPEALKMAQIRMHNAIGAKLAEAAGEDGADPEGPEEAPAAPVPAKTPGTKG